MSGKNKTQTWKVSLHPCESAVLGREGLFQTTAQHLESYSIEESLPHHAHVSMALLLSDLESTDFLF